MQGTTSRNTQCPCGSGTKYKKCCGVKGPRSAAADHEGPRLIVLQPTRGSISLETHQAMMEHMDGSQTIVCQVAREPVDVARNKLARIVGDILNQRPEFRDAPVLWIDDDAWWGAGTITAMMRKLRTLGENDLLSAWCCTRSPYAPAMAFEEDPEHAGMMRTHPGLRDASYEDAIEVESLSTHFLMHRSLLLAKLGSDPFSHLESAVGTVIGEDISFCRRVRMIGGKCYIVPGQATTVLHVDVRTGLAYTPYGPPFRILGGSKVVQANAEDICRMAGATAGVEVVSQGDSATIIKDAPQRRAYSADLDNKVAQGDAAAQDDGRESPVIIFAGIPIGNEPGRPVRLDLNGMTRDGAFQSLMNLLNTRALFGFTLMSRADKEKHMAKIADMVGTSRDGGPKQVIMSAQRRM